MNPNDTVITNYEAISEWFDANRSKELMEKEYLERVMAHLPKSAFILDLGCGTGEPIAEYFIKKGTNVFGVDSSPRMIQYCKDRFPTMTWTVGDMRTLNLDDQFDAVIAWDSFFHLNQSEQRAMFPKFRKNLKDGGLLLFTTGSKAGEVYSTMDGHEFFHASLDISEYESLLSQNGLNVLLNRINDPDCGEHTVWLAQAKTITSYERESDLV